MKQTKSLKIAVAILSVLVVLLLILSGLAVVSAATGEPLILMTKDYMDEQVLPGINEKNLSQDQSLSGLESKYNTLLAQYQALTERFNSYIGTGSEDVPVSTKGFTEVKIESGKALYPKGENYNCLEVILRRGTAQIISPYDTLGILDATTGDELLDGANMPVNHYILVPHTNDGRCIAASGEDVWVLVRGEYTIE